MSIIYGVRSNQTFAYHYTSANTAIDYILRDRTLRLAPFASTNDPKESKDWQFAGYRGRIAQTFVDLGFSEAIKRSARLACFCSDQPGLTGNHLDDILLRGFARPRMWAQYAEKHTGVCLIFDRARLLDRVRDQFPDCSVRSGEVAYANRVNIPRIFDGEFAIDLNMYDRMGADAYAAHHIEKYAGPLFFEKLEDWRTEVEWRVLLHNASGIDCLVHFEDALIGVMHGAAVPGDVSKRLIALSDEPGIEHMGLGWINHVPWYDFQREAWGYQDRITLRKMGLLSPTLEGD
jgi:hypothetical protein